MSSPPNTLATGVWPIEPSRITTLVQTTRTTRPMKLKPSSRTLATMVRSECWNFEKYVCMHQDQHTILQSLVQHGYAGIDEHSKVRHLLDSIKTNELDTAKGQIWASPLLQNNFDHCVMLFQDFINNK